MERRDMQERLYLSTIGEDAAAWARRYGLGLELAEFCTAWNLDRERERTMAGVKNQMEASARFWFHGPFAELCPAAIDPLVREIAARRYGQALDTAVSLGVSRMVLHAGFIPQVYYPQWFTEQSVLFWKEFLTRCPRGVTIALENVMEPGPEMLVEIVSQVNDPRLRLCLDVGHANANCSRVPPAEWMEPMAPWLSHVHIHNNLGDLDLHSDLGTGSVPMESVLDRLLELPVTFTIENMNCRKSIQWLLDRGYIV